ncbi:MAG TPA: class I SAM-dependent methyltransferase [Pseudolabrys sp.]|nr:class I SAM-dependent methyltransferase [Pseudolabrys sp.]
MIVRSSDNAIPHCRFCGAALEHVFADLGATPLANRNLQPNEQDSERVYPLIARICSSCLLVQVDDSVPPGEIFSDYDYFSSYSSTWVEHGRRYSEAMIARFGLGSHSLVVEVGSNDGCLLKHFKGSGIEVRGIDPAANVAAQAIVEGIPTEIAFFGVRTALDMTSRGLAADLIAANNVLAHVPDINDFVRGFAVLLKPDGVVTFEFPHVLQLIDGLQFDTIYHEHFFYLSLFAVERILAAAGLRVFDVEELPTHGGSLRLYVCHKSASHEESARVGKLRAAEKHRGLHTVQGYLGFAGRIEEVKKSFLTFLEGARREGKRVAAYGAAAKGNTFLNYCGVNNADIVAVYDRNLTKQGKLTPGSHIQIKAPDSVQTDRPDFLVILPWNLVDEIRSSMRIIESWGGKFVVAVPATRQL